MICGKESSEGRSPLLDPTKTPLVGSTSMEDAIKLHDWFFTFDRLDPSSPSWSVVAYGRGHASTSSSKAPLRPHIMVDRLSQKAFKREDGKTVELIGDCDSERASQAGKLPTAARRVLELTFASLRKLYPCQ